MILRSVKLKAGDCGFSDGINAMLIMRMITTDVIKSMFRQHLTGEWSNAQEPDDKNEIVSKFNNDGHPILIVTDLKDNSTTMMRDEEY